MINISPYDIVRQSRDLKRLTSLEWIQLIFDDFVELHGDRYYGDDEALVGGIAQLGQLAVTVIGTEKGHDLQSNMRRNFGTSKPEGYRKAFRLMKQAEKFHRPIVTLINTAGAFCGIEAEERGIGEAIAQNLLEMSQLEVPVIALLMGEGGSGGALALAVANQVWMMDIATYSILSPEGFASILWRDSSRVQEASEQMKFTVADLLAMKIVDRRIAEVDASGHRIAPDQIAQSIRQHLIQEFNQIKTMRDMKWAKERQMKFRQF